MKELKNFKAGNKTAQPNQIDELKEQMGKFDGYSEDQLIDQLIKSVKKSKKEGTYSSAQMKSFLQIIAPQITDQQKTKLSNLINLIEEDEI